MNRKQRREAKKQMKKDGTTEAQEKMGQKFSLIGKMPNECHICGAAFDKKSREMSELLSHLKNFKKTLDKIHKRVYIITISRSL